MATGRIVIDAERCKGCELCLPACPQSVIHMADSLNTKGYHPALYEDPMHNCTGCALCAVVCPDSCITVFRDFPQKQPASSWLADKTNLTAEDADPIMETEAHV